MTVETRDNWRIGQAERGREYQNRIYRARILQKSIARKLGVREDALSLYLSGGRKWPTGKEEAFVKALEEAGA